MDPVCHDRTEHQPTTVHNQGKRTENNTKNGNALNHLPPDGRAFVDNLLLLKAVSESTIDGFLQANAPRLPEFDSAASLGAFLVEQGLLTQYQLDRIVAGKTYGLMLGQYRVLERLGAGGMGIVFLGEHTMMKRRAAVKVLPVDDDCAPALVKRFYAEMKVLAQLHHPNIVAAYDAGRVDAPPGFPNLLYLVMELIDGCDLERHVEQHGRVPIAKACEWVRQAAHGLQEAHNHNLVHRDIKPSNLLLTKDGTVKLVDFGLVRQFSSTMTDPKTTLGTLDFMPPEQCVDPTSVGALADIYSLGATLFWLLTAEGVYPRSSSLLEALTQIQQCPPRSLRALRPNVPVELEAIVNRMLERDPARRPPMALNVMKSLEPFTSD
jgi:eukaryotic-like serine/threonine-protein kinase